MASSPASPSIPNSLPTNSSTGATPNVRRTEPTTPPYGWPTIAYGIEYRGGPITGDSTAKPGTEQPLNSWDPVIAPGNMTFYTCALVPTWKMSLFAGALGSTHLVRHSLQGEKGVGEERLLRKLKERILDVVQGPDGAFYILTDNRKDRLLKLVPKK